MCPTRPPSPCRSSRNGRTCDLGLELFCYSNKSSTNSNNTVVMICSWKFDLLSRWASAALSLGRLKGSFPGAHQGLPELWVPHWGLLGKGLHIFVGFISGSPCLRMIAVLGLYWSPPISGNCLNQVGLLLWHSVRVSNFLECEYLWSDLGSLWLKKLPHMSYSLNSFKGVI